MAIFKKVLFPTDFSSNSNHALEHAVRMTDFHAGELIVQHVVNNYFEVHPHWTTLFDIHEMQKYMDFYAEEEMAKTLAPYAGQISIRPVISKGKPAEEICALAEKELVDLVVMGSARGVVTNRVVRMTNRPVLAISSLLPASSPRRAERILVTTDFSEHSRKVVQYAFDLQKAFDASLYLLYVIETTRAIEFALKQGHYVDAKERMKNWALHQLVNLTPTRAVNDPRVFRLVETGEPSERIASVAHEIGADLTILGTHEYGTVHKHLLGTTTDRLLSSLDVPLLTVKL
jgi:nucleotide-binding universal stress UspA family protein